MSTQDAKDPMTSSADALAVLRSQLDDARAARRLNKTELARAAGLGRTVVSQALSPRAAPPTKDTISALARALCLPLPPLLALLATAVGNQGRDRLSSSLGRPISDWDPLDLEVHPAAPPLSAAPDSVDSHAGLPGYVRRPHDDALARHVAAAANGSSKMVVLVGSSSTGKTRACWEAIQLLADMGWRLWHPFDPTRAEAALADLEQVSPKTVVWLNEAQHYLGAGQGIGERLAAALATLLADQDRGPVLVLGTLWPEYAHSYMALPRPGHEDPHSQVRALIANRRLSVPDKFDTAAITTAQALADAGDLQLAAALQRATDGCLTQDLAGGPELLHRYSTAQPAARAVLQAAMDSHRLGTVRHLPIAFLQGAAEDYLTEAEFDSLPDDWFEQALADLARPVHGSLAPLRRIRTRRPRPVPGVPSSPFPHQRYGPVYRLADYLEQHGHHERALLCPPPSFWHAAHDHITDSNDLVRLAQAALQRYRLQWAFYLQRASGVSELTGGGVQARVVRMRETAGDLEGVDALVRQEAATGSAWALLWLAARRESIGDRNGAESLLRKAADTGHVGALVRLATLREDAGDTQEAETLARLVADTTGYPQAFLPRMVLHKDEDEQKGCVRLAPSPRYIWTAPSRVTRTYADGKVEVLFGTAEEAPQQGTRNAQALFTLAREERSAQNREGAEFLARQAMESANAQLRPHVLFFLAELREEAGDHDEAEAFARQAADAGDSDMLIELALIRSKAGDQARAKRLLQSATEAGDTYALLVLADLLQQGGDEDEAEAVARQAIRAGEVSAYLWLAQSRQQAGETETVQALVRQAADAGAFHDGFFSGLEPWNRDGAEPWLADSMTAWWPYGLDADGAPSEPW